jgi:hypothetical protein
MIRHFLYILLKTLKEHKISIKENLTCFISSIDILSDTITDTILNYKYDLKTNIINTINTKPLKNIKYDLTKLINNNNHEMNLDEFIKYCIDKNLELCKFKYLPKLKELNLDFINKITISENIDESIYNNFHNDNLNDLLYESYIKL